MIASSTSLREFLSLVPPTQVPVAPASLSGGAAAAAALLAGGARAQAAAGQAGGGKAPLEVSV